MGLGSLVSRVVPAAVGFVTGGPVGAVTAAYATEQGKKQEKKIKKQIAQRQQQEQKLIQELNMMGSGEFGTPGLTFTQPKVQQAGFFDRLTGLASNVGSTLLTGLEGALPGIIQEKVLGRRPVNVGQQPALTTITNVGAQESQGSGSIQAGAGSLLAPVLTGARNLLKTPQGQLALGGGSALVGSLFGGDQKQMRITRKMKSQARSLLNMTGGNLSLTADFLGISEDALVALLLKRFRNDGPVVTKAALRKTKSTIRKLKNMCDMYDDLRPAARRRTPMRRATRSSTTLIKN